MTGEELLLADRGLSPGCWANLSLTSGRGYFGWVEEVSAEGFRLAVYDRAKQRWTGQELVAPWAAFEAAWVRGPDEGDDWHLAFPVER